MWRVGGWGKFLAVALADLIVFAAVLYMGAPIKWALIGLAVVALAEYTVATM